MIRNIDGTISPASAGARCVLRGHDRISPARNGGLRSRVRRFESCWGRQGSPTELPISYRQNCGGGLVFSIAPVSDGGVGVCLAWPGVHCGGAGWARAWLPRWGEDDHGDRAGLCLSAVGEVVAQAGAPPACALGGADFVAGGQVSPGAILRMLAAISSRAAKMDWAVMPGAKPVHARRTAAVRAAPYCAAVTGGEPRPGREP